MPKSARILVGLFLGLPCVVAEEADQYLAWGHELEDAAPVINRYINERVREEIDAANARGGPPCECETLTLRILPNIYLDRFRADLLDFVSDPANVDAYPAQTTSDILELSIYREVPPQFVIRVLPTIRIGDVYLGVDKLAHLIGIGRRYYVRYLYETRIGVPETEATENAIRWGILTENSVLGRFITGIFSCADLEANYQGLMFARQFCEGDDPYLEFDGRAWRLAREVDIRQFVTPAFDESFYPPLYHEDVLRAVLDVLPRDYADSAKFPEIARRFQHYGLTPPSPAMELVEQYLVEHEVRPQWSDLLSALHLDGEDPRAPLNPLNLDAVRQPPSSP
jgi:hypothetical protein